ncbi:acetyl-CoA C-acetyltransferase [Motiliproteus sp. SC1-56]|uniref:acetyl-CoA C-acetyltransferase n=1 Tax=Motiliproteus sp. SC1-56 TaxID=2799565 RepID=UPI001A8EF06F|nr:acetyl-CoA C-acetyltransferase [Motiliproteus sp. SC1-56]
MPAIDNASDKARDGRAVYLVDGTRTPFLKVRGKPGPFTPVDLAVQCGRPLLLRQRFAPRAIDQVVLGCVNVLGTEMNPARVAALRLGLGEAVPAFTVQINCGSGMQSIDTAWGLIRNGERELVLAGGAESLSHAPLQLHPRAVSWLAELRQARTLKERAKLLGRLRPGLFKPVVALQQGLTDPVAGLNMGETAEVLAHLFRVTREEADTYAVESHQRLARAHEEGFLAQEVPPAIAPDGTLYAQDDGVRPDSSPQSLARLRPVFERPYGQVTAGNSSQVSDGASWVLLASDTAVQRHGLKPLARLVDSHWAGLDPEIMGLAPVAAVAGLLRRRELALDAIDLWELNEAFAAQVLACLKAMADADFCRQALGLEQALGQLDRRRLNIDGGAISLGHPVGASGTRIVLHLAYALRRTEQRLGIATQCIGGGQSGALLIENPEAGR